MDLPIIILGSGASIPFLNSQFYRTHCGLHQKLVDIIKGNYSIGLNDFYRFGCPTTFVSWSDWDWYANRLKYIKDLPLLIGDADARLKNDKKDLTLSNTILIKKSNKYNGINSIKLGCYCKHLVGMWALSLAIGLGFKNIFLIGYDGCEINAKTHFYQGVIDEKKYRGVGKKEIKNGHIVYKTSTYERRKRLNEKWFAPFKNETNAKIYNVSPESAIDVFEKIDYETFYSKVKNNHIDQNEARKNIKKIIQEKLK